MKNIFTVLTFGAILGIVILTGINQNKMASSFPYLSTVGQAPSAQPGDTISASGTGAQTITSPPPVLGANTVNYGATNTSPTYTQGVNDPGTIAAYNQAIANEQAAIDRSGSQLQSGYGAIDSSYQNALNQLLLSRNQGQSSYNQNKQTTATDYVGAKNTIGANAGEALNGLQRLLGARGAGGSSAYNVAAPQAVARGATLQRADVANQFGSNNQALDTNWNNFLTDYNNQVSSAGNQKDQQRQSLEQNINTNKASLLQSLAQLASQRDQAQGGSGVGAAQPYLNQANQLLNSASSYSTAPINYQTSAYSAPSLASYTPGEQPNAQFNSQSGNDYFSPYLQSLLGKKQTQVA